MAPVPSRLRRTAAVPLSLMAAAALAFLPSAATAAPAGSAAKAAEGPNLIYVVNTKTNHGTVRMAEQAISDARGSVVMSYPQIGVIVANSSNPDFAKQLRTVPGIQSAGAAHTAPLAPTSADVIGAPTLVNAQQAGASGNATKAGQEPLEHLQWNLPAIHADKANEKTLGSKNVKVAVIDTGVDDTHPDLAPNFDAKDSVNCVGGKPNTTPGAWRPTVTTSGSAHGTHVAGIIAAARNGVGVAGVAPGVRLAAIRVAEPSNSLFFPESVVCGFVWAAEHGIDVTNNSYYVDPWEFNCQGDPDQKAITDAVARAARYAQNKGTLNVSAAGNDNFDMAAKSIVDTSSPDDSTPADRTIDPSKCLDVPNQLPGVVTVSATGSHGDKSFFSTYGKGFVDIAAPGGDPRQLPPAPAESGNILSTLPGNQYGYLSGTSMASPHVVAVAALLKTMHPSAGPGQLSAMLGAQAQDVPCPTLYDTNGDGKADAVCQGGKSFNGFYGQGVVDALKAVQ